MVEFQFFLNPNFGSWLHHHIFAGKKPLQFSSGDGWPLTWNSSEAPLLFCPTPCLWQSYRLQRRSKITMLMGSWGKFTGGMKNLICYLPCYYTCYMGNLYSMLHREIFISPLVHPGFVREAGSTAFTHWMHTIESGCWNFCRKSRAEGPNVPIFRKSKGNPNFKGPWRGMFFVEIWACWKIGFTRLTL